jgi:hypothetical protein
MVEAADHKQRLFAPFLDVYPFTGNVGPNVYSGPHIYMGFLNT